MKKSRTVVVASARGVVGTLRLPGDKSISHRYAMLAAIAEGTTRLHTSPRSRLRQHVACIRPWVPMYMRREQEVRFRAGA